MRWILHVATLVMPFALLLETSVLEAELAFVPPRVTVVSPGELGGVTRSEPVRSLLHAAIQATPEVTVPSPTPDPGSQQAPAGAGTELDRYENGGVLLRQTFRSEALDREMSYNVFLPPGYQESERRFASVYMLHGLDGTPDQWPTLGMGVAADRLIAGGGVEPVMIVFPFGSNSYFLNEPDGLRWADHVGCDVVADVDARFRTLTRAPSRAVGGLSMGGDAALRYGLTWPDTFGVVGAHSPSIRRSFEEAPPGLFADEEAFSAANAFWLIRNHDVPARLKVWLDVGDGDPWWFNVEALHDLLTARNIAHDFTYFVGEHDDAYWATHLSDYLGFYSVALSHEAGLSRSR